MSFPDDLPDGASENYDGDEDADFEDDTEAAMATEARQQLADLDALVPYAAQLSRARSGLPVHEHERLLAELRGIS